METFGQILIWCPYNYINIDVYTKRFCNLDIIYLTMCIDEILGKTKWHQNWPKLCDSQWLSPFLPYLIIPHFILYPPRPSLIDYEETLSERLYPTIKMILVQAATKLYLQVSFYEFIQVDAIIAQGPKLYQSLVHFREVISYGLDHCEEIFSQHDQGTLKILKLLIHKVQLRDKK